MLISSDDKAIVIKTSLIPLKNTRTSGGVTLMTLKKGHTLSEGLSDFEDKYDTSKGYKKLKIPASGQAIAERSLANRQLTIDT